VIAVCTNHDAGELHALGADVVLPDLAAIRLQHVLGR
jgi:hypothetical protein